MLPISDSPQAQRPVLVTRIVHADGTYTLAFRVYCAAHGETVPVDACRECVSCSEVGCDATGSHMWVRCASPAGPAHSSGLTVGDALQEGTIAVDENVLIRDVAGLFVERGLHSLVVTDSGGRVSGVVRESQLLPYIREQAGQKGIDAALDWQRTWHEPARNLMSSVRSVHEGTSLRHALGLMATRHDRQLVIVDPSGAPVGTLWDVQAMHILQASEHKSSSSH